jgi:hypothetical protein
MVWKREELSQDRAIRYFNVYVYPKYELLFVFVWWVNGEMK